MNYRHAFHAGNPADCMKHALLLWLLGALLRKPAPVFVLDTHAGAGRYDLLSGPAERTGEWRGGIARLLHQPPAPLLPFVAAVERLGLYPGSPLLAASVLRPTDRLACCELHPEEHAALHRLFRADKRVGVHARDGYGALAALLPPREGRGLVLIDPPFEVPGEFDRLLAALRTGAQRWNHAVHAAWYPVKHRSPVHTFHEGVCLSGLRNVVAAELLWREPTDPARLNGCGLLVRNPPFGFGDAATEILGALLHRLGTGQPGAATAVLRVADE